MVGFFFERWGRVHHQSHIVSVTNIDAIIIIVIIILSLLFFFLLLSSFPGSLGGYSLSLSLRLILDLASTSYHILRWGGACIIAAKIIWNWFFFFCFFHGEGEAKRGMGTGTGMVCYMVYSVFLTFQRLWLWLRLWHMAYGMAWHGISKRHFCFLRAWRGVA